MMRCSKHGDPVDTDEDIGGLWIGDGYICEACTEELADDPCEFVLEDLTQDPDCDCRSCAARKVLL